MKNLIVANWKMNPVSQKEAKNIYTQGPISQSFLRYFGIGNYGIRTPIYNIDAASTIN